MAARKRVEKLMTKPGVKKEEKPAPAKKKTMYVAKVARIWHPDQELYIDETPVELKMDSFTEVQLQAGIIEEVKV